jgi:hypothetical protein
MASWSNPKSAIKLCFYSFVSLILLASPLARLGSLSLDLTQSELVIMRALIKATHSLFCGVAPSDESGDDRKRSDSARSNLDPSGDGQITRSHSPSPG